MDPKPKAPPRPLRKGVFDASTLKVAVPTNPGAGRKRSPLVASVRVMNAPFSSGMSTPGRRGSALKRLPFWRSVI